MKLVTFKPSPQQPPLTGELKQDTVIAYQPQISMIELIANGKPQPANGESYRLDQVELLAPVPKPQAIYGIGLNYASHAKETGREKPEVPVVFTKLVGSVAPPAGPVNCPSVVKRLDYEGELCVVIGPDQKPFGYAVANDVSARDLQRREPQWVRAKGADSFCPYGPAITTADEITDPGNLTLKTWVNGELRQHASTAEMLFSIEQIIEFIGQTSTLHPGDLILTGTPSGVGMAMEPRQFLQTGDTVKIEIQQLGSIQHQITQN